MMSTADALKTLFSRRGYASFEPRVLDWPDKKPPTIVPICFVTIPINEESGLYRVELPFTFESADDLIPLMITRAVELALRKIEADGYTFRFKEGIDVALL